ncbi:hypothetical protein CIHG_09870 [Coccidioides immitis H538.4]|uniref:Uncharacterized protein n=2 Tax=Coccidioides immitis TaxID=5501 RepID=A0A0J8S5J6_COCIT|nr:hypothetical protein CIRG_02480 [Coccidioides immitis RMSCC 2394]KMU92116.1 hypothetical protein CIHG_09870 [Coccidioides immitis H538.4]
MLSQEAHLGRPASGFLIFDIIEMYCFRLSKLLKLLELTNFPTIRTRDAHQFEDDEEIYKGLKQDYHQIFPLNHIQRGTLSGHTPVTWVYKCGHLLFINYFGIVPKVVKPSFRVLFLQSVLHRRIQIELGSGYPTITRYETHSSHGLNAVGRIDRESRFEETSKGENAVLLKQPTTFTKQDTMARTDSWRIFLVALSRS